MSLTQTEPEERCAEAQNQRRHEVDDGEDQLIRTRHREQHEGEDHRGEGRERPQKAWTHGRLDDRRHTATEQAGSEPTEHERSDRVDQEGVDGELLIGVRDREIEAETQGAPDDSPEEDRDKVSERTVLHRREVTSFRLTTP